jgi:germination protein, Ger(x)C family
MIRPRRLPACIALICALTVLPGCWDIKDINHRVLPIIMGISYSKDHKYKVSLQVPVPTARNIRILVVSAEAATLSKAISHLDMNIESNLDLTHMQLILFDRKVAEEGIQDEIAFAMRTQEIPMKALLAVTNEDMESFLRKTGNSVVQNGSSFMNFFNKNAGWDPQITLSALWQAFETIHSETKDIALPVIRAGTSTMLEFEGSALMSRDRMVGQIPPEQSLLVNIANNQIEDAVLEVTKSSSLLIVRNSTRHRGSIVDGRPVLHTRMQLSAIVKEKHDDKSEDEIASELTEQIRTRYELLYEKLLKAKSDPTGAGQHFRGLLPYEELTSWRERYYPRLILKCDVSTVIVNQGNISSN